MRDKRPWLTSATIAALLIAGGTLPGCESGLFHDDQNANARKLGYFDDDSSATAAQSSRKQSESMGFGMANGSAADQ